MPEKDHPMKLKTFSHDGVEYAVIQDGKPVYIDDAGKEIAFDAPGTVATIGRLNGEARTHREAKEAAETKLKAFEGVDPVKAREATEKLALIDANKLVAVGDMDAAIQAAIKPYAEKLAGAEQVNGNLSQALTKETIGNRFAMSKFAAEKLTPAGVDLVRTIYADQLKVEDGRVYGVRADGSKITSMARPGEIADFDEVIATFVEAYPHKDHILKGDIKGGGGAQQPNGGGGTKSMKQSEFDKLDAKTRATRMSEGYQLIAD